MPEGLRLTDLGSRNGTYYLGQRIECAVLAPGSTVRVGDVEVALEPHRSEVEHAAPYVDTEYRGIVGAAPVMRRLFGSLKRMEGSLVSVLIEGESGVGKELVARAIHQGSSLAAGPFVAVNCGALPRELAASELFGHVKGAFTGAVARRVGAFEQARGGTLFLDEIGELPVETQPALLRILENRELIPVGGDRGARVNVRILSATNRSLDEEVAHGRFREDLFYRLAVVRLRVPSLRERSEDIAAIATALSQQMGVTLPAHVLEALKTRTYAGNVRELRNVLQAFAALGELPPESRTRPTALDSTLADFADTSQPYAAQKEALIERFTRVYLQALLDETRGNQTQAARRAGLNRTYLSELLGRLGLARRARPE